MGFSEEITGTYSNGTLKLDRKLNLPEGARVRAMLRSESIDLAAAAKALDDIKRIRASGSFRSGGRKFTREEMHERL